MYRLTLNGKVQYRELELLKSYLLRQAKHVKGLRERGFAANQVSIEVDFSGEPEQFMSLISGAPIEGLSLEAGRWENQELILTARRQIFQ